MQVERIEALLRSQPPDESTYRGELILGPRAVELDRHPVRDRWAATGTLAGIAVVAALVAVLVTVLGPLAASPINAPSPSIGATSTLRPSPGLEASPQLAAIPWIDATPPPAPTPEPTADPRSLPACASSDLILTAQGWGGATGSLAGGASVVNLGSNPCTVVGKPGVELLDRHGAVIAAGPGPEAAAGSALVVLPTGGGAGVTTVWSGWCGDPPSRPLRIRLTLPLAGGALTAAVREDGPGGPGTVPRCDSPGSASTFGVPPEACAGEALAPYLGQWGAAAGTSYANLVVLNLGHVDCLVDTIATLELRDADGRRMAAATSAPPSDSARTLLLPPGWAVAVTIGYSDWCTPQPALPLRADLVMGSERIAVLLRSEIPVPPCMAAPMTPAPDMFFNGLLAVPGTPTAPEPDPVDTLPVAVTLSPLPPTPPGGILDYTVTLTNVSPFDKSLNLAALCPTYTERLSFTGSRAAVDIHLALNCGPAGVLAAHFPMTFAMRLPIPADAPPGTASLVWQLGERGPGAKGAFEIRP
jgi:Protein of unknown function (DUF4232)